MSLLVYGLLALTCAFLGGVTVVGCVMGSNERTGGQ